MAMKCIYWSSECTGCMQCYDNGDQDYTDYYEEDDSLDYDE